MHRAAYMRWVRNEFGLPAQQELVARLGVGANLDLEAAKGHLRDILDEYRKQTLEEMAYLNLLPYNS